MDYEKIKIGSRYKLDWDLIKENDFICDCGGKFDEIYWYQQQSEVFGEVIRKPNRTNDKLELRLYTKEETLFNWWVNINKLIPLENSVKKVK